MHARTFTRKRAGDSREGGREGRGGGSEAIYSEHVLRRRSRCCGVYTSATVFLSLSFGALVLRSCLSPPPSTLLFCAGSRAFHQNTPPTCTLGRERFNVSHVSGMPVAAHLHSAAPFLVPVSFVPSHSHQKSIPIFDLSRAGRIVVKRVSKRCAGGCIDGSTLRRLCKAKAS